MSSIATKVNVPGLVNSYQMRHTNDPPISPGRLLQDATVLELLGVPGHPDRQYLYAEWSDNFKYLQSWDLGLLTSFLALAQVEIAAPVREWSRTLSLELLADYNCPVRIRRRAKGYVDHADASE